MGAHFAPSADQHGDHRQPVDPEQCVADLARLVVIGSPVAGRPGVGGHHGERNRKLTSHLATKRGIKNDR